MIANEKIKIEQFLRGNQKVISLNGIVDEDASFESLLKLKDPMVFNFKNVTSINSCGVRNWVNFLKEISGTEVYFEECPPLIVRQMNMIPSFVGHAHVKSVFVPYVCDRCDSEKLILIHENEFKGGSKTLEESLPCEACKEGEMELDGHPQQYFAFAK